MQIIEYFLRGKENNPDTCEDGLVIGKNLIAVIDGVTSKGTRLWNGMTSGCYAKKVLIDYLEGDVEKQSAAELLDNLDAVLREQIKDFCAEPFSEEYPRAAIIVYNDVYKEIWVYGDCQCRINGDIYLHSKKIDELNADLRAFYLEYQILQGIDINSLVEDDLGRKYIKSNLLMQSTFENISGYFGYPILNGMGIEKSMIKSYPVSEGDTIILASDGYPVLEQTLNESEETLAYILRNDPMCFRLYHSTKGIKQGNISFDDRAFCRFIV